MESWGTEGAQDHRRNGKKEDEEAKQRGKTEYSVISTLISELRESKMLRVNMQIRNEYPDYIFK